MLLKKQGEQGKSIPHVNREEPVPLDLFWEAWQIVLITTVYNSDKWGLARTRAQVRIITLFYELQKDCISDKKKKSI